MKESLGQECGPAEVGQGEVCVGEVSRERAVRNARFPSGRRCLERIARPRYWMLLLMVIVAASTGHIGADEPSPALAEAEERYEFMAHTFAANGAEFEIYVKLDLYTGKTWRFHAGTMKWTAIAEPDRGRPNADEKNRYELHSHDYSLRGEPTELIIRADLVSGNTWFYRGTYKSWQQVQSDK